MQSNPESCAGATGRVRMLAAIAAALVAALLYLHLSELGGRLAQDLTYDDVSYANEAALHLDALVQGGLPGLAHSLSQVPPHSPWSTGLAMLAFLLGGLGEFALYAANTVVLLTAAIFVARRSRLAPAATAALALAATLLSPIAFFAIQEFRPDIMLGLVTAIAAWLWWSGIGGRDRAAPMHAGIAMGAALWIKPSFFAHTLAIALALAAGGLLARSLARRWPTWAPLAATPRDVARFLATALVVAAPYIAVEGRSAFEYFWLNTQGANRDVWSFPRGASLGQLVRMTAPFAFVHGGWNTLVAIPAAIAMAIALARRDRDGAMRLVAWLATGALSFAIIFAGRHKNGMFFATYHWIALLAAVVAFVELDRRLARGPRLALRLVLGASILSLVVANNLERRTPPSPDTLRGHSWNDRILDLVEEDRRESGGDVPRIYVAFSGPVNSGSLTWLARKRRMPIHAWSDPYLRDRDEALRRFERSDYLVLPDPIEGDYARYMPDASLVEPLLVALHGDPQARELDAGQGRHRYHLFGHRRARRDATLPVLALPGAALSIEGLRVEEGPYPDRPMPLPRLRWLEHGAGRVCTLVNAGAPLHLELEYFAAGPGRLAILGENGERLADLPLVAARFGAQSIDYTAPSSRQCLEFRVTPEGPTGTAPPLFFSKIDLREGR